MRRCAGFFMGNTVSDPKDLLTPFPSTNLLMADRTTSGLLTTQEPRPRQRRQLLEPGPKAVGHAY